ncbi:MAG: putative acyl carrier protein phosphodiesterase [Devosia sp.]|nr:putative acyl carrier protein phosphodiesterase [Devosia sp.]
MKTIFRLDASIRKDGSTSRALADTLETALVARLDDSTIIRRDVGLEPLPPTVWAASAFAGYTADEQRSDEQRQAQAVAVELANELVTSDAYVFAVPLYNFGVSQHVKNWVDILLTEPRFAPGTPKLLAGRPAYLIVVRGGGYGAGTPRHGWDHATGWLTRILVDVLGLEVELIESELTLADFKPEMASLRELAAQNLQRAHGIAGEHGRRLATLFEDVAAVAA